MDTLLLSGRVTVAKGARRARAYVGWRPPVPRGEGVGQGGIAASRSRARSAKRSLSG
ncbi:hypothetical protein GCM10009834_41680 [Streptomonospora arabica]